MIEIRRWASPTVRIGDHRSTASSGPRCVMASRPLASHARCMIAEVDPMPTIPHTMS